MDERLEDLHSSLITSEQRRIQLNQELQQLMSCSSKSDRLRDIQLKSQMESFKSHRQKSLERNQMIRRQMQQFEMNMSSVAAKTQALRALKVEYEEYIERLYPRWKEQVLAKAAEEREKEHRLASMTRDIHLDEELPLPVPPNTRPSQHSLLTTSHDQSHDLCRCVCLTCTNNETSQHSTSSLSTQLSHLFESSHTSSCISSSSSQLTLRPLKIVSCPGVVSSPHSPAASDDHQRSLLGFKEAFDGIRSLLHDGSGTDWQSGNSFDERTPNGSLYRMGEELPVARRSSTPDYERLEVEPRTNRAGQMSASQQSVVSEKSVTFADYSLKPPQESRREEQRSADLRYTSRDSPRRLTPSPSELIRTSMEFGDSSSIATVGSSQSIVNPSAASLPPPHPSSSPHRPDQSTSVEVHQPPVVPQNSGYVNPPSAPSPPTTSQTPLVHDVIIPSAKADDDSPAADVLDTADSAGADNSPINAPAPSKAPAVRKPADAVVEVGVSMSSLNTTTEEVSPVDLAKTDEFKSMLGGETTTRVNYESDDSEDSMVAAIENEYSRQLALKTNTLPMQRPITMPSEGTRDTPSPEAPSDDEDSLSGVMGYTPSFASNVKSGQTGSTKGGEELPAKYTDTLVPPTSTINSTGSNSSSKRKPVFLRTNSDVESLSDLPITSNQSGASGTATKTAEDDLDDDFDFYG